MILARPVHDRPVATALATALVAATLLAGLASHARAQDTIPVLDEWVTAGSCRAIVGQGAVMHAGRGGYLVTTDVADPQSPQLLATTWFGAQVQDLALFERDGRVLVAAGLGHAGLRIVDVTDPAVPEPRGQLTDVEAWRVVAIGARLYVAASSGGVAVVDPADPDAPLVTGQLPVRPAHEPRALAGRPGTLYVAAQDDSLEAFVLTDPDHPQPIGATRGGNYVDLACNGPLLLALTSTGLEIIDVSNFTGLPVVGTWTPELEENRPHAVWLQGTHAWVTDLESGLALIDLADPAAPQTLAWQEWPAGQAWAVGEVVDLVALGTRDRGVVLVAAESGAIVERGRATEPWPATLPLLDAAGDVAVAASRDQQFLVFGGLPSSGAVGTLEVPGNFVIDACGTDGDFAVAGCWRLDGGYAPQRLWIVDVTDPQAPVTLHFGHGLPTGMNDRAQQVEVEDGLAWIVCRGLRVYDLAVIDELGPADLGLYGFGHRLGEFALVGDDRVCIWDDSEGELRMLDRTNTWDMTVVEVLDVPGSPVAMDERAGRLYVASPVAVRIFDVTAGPPSELLAVVPLTAYVQDVRASADGLWVSYGTGGLERWDLTDPLAPVLAASLTDRGRIDGLALAGDRLVANAPHRGLLWLGATVTEAPAAPWATALLPNHPNPFNPATQLAFTLARDAHVQLAIHDLRGRLVRHLVAAELPAGRHTVTWHGRDDSGRSVASGVYLSRLVAGGHVSARTLTLVR